jgi:hypothetical protein
MYSEEEKRFIALCRRRYLSGFYILHIITQYTKGIDKSGPYGPVER